MTVRILVGDVREQLKTLPDRSVHMCVTSPPYWSLRDYQVVGQIGLEATPQEYVAVIVDVFREVKRVLRDDGVCFINIGDSYASGGRGGGMEGEAGEKQRSNEGALLGPKRAPPGLKPKDLVGIPWRLAFALQDDGWWLRQDIVWAKPNPMPESVRDRCTKSHEYIFLLSKNERYFFDAEAIAEESVYKDGEGGHQRFGKPGGKAEVEYGQLVSGEIWTSKGTRNKRSVWTITTRGFSEAHFATFPPELPEICIKAGCPKCGVVLDPFFGAGTTGLVADRLGRDCIGIELNPDYAEMARRRIVGDAPLFAEVSA
jgi:DNA modification methylase